MKVCNKGLLVGGMVPFMLLLLLLLGRGGGEAVVSHDGTISATRFPSAFQPSSLVSVFYMTPSVVFPKGLQACYKSRWKRSIFSEGSATKHLEGYTPEDLGDYYLHFSMQSYPGRTTSLELADVVIINTFPILSFNAGKCRHTSHYSRQEEVFQWMSEHRQLLIERPTLFSCTSWLCQKAVIKQNSLLLAEINASILINELNPMWLDHSASDTWQNVGPTKYPSKKTRQGVERNKTRQHYGIPIPYTAHHSIPRPPETGLVKTRKFLFVGSLRNDEVRQALSTLADEPDVFLEVTWLGGKNHGEHQKLQTVQNYANLMLSGELCFVPRGDTPTSRRLFDAMLCGCLPVIISDTIDISLPFRSTIPYNDFAFRISEREWVNNPKAVLQQLKLVSAGELEQRRATMAIYAPYIDWLNGANVLALILDDAVHGRQQLFAGTH